MLGDIGYVNKLAEAWPGSTEEFVATHGAEVRERLPQYPKRARRFDVFHDAPFGHNHIHPMALLSLDPDLKLIWIERPFNEWLRSVEKWERTHPKIYPRWEKWDSDKDAVIRARVRTRYISYGRFLRVRSELPDRCLLLDLADFSTYQPLADFFGVDAPAGAPPRLNPSTL